MTVLTVLEKLKTPIRLLGDDAIMDNFNFYDWVLSHDGEKYTIIASDEQHIRLETDYGIAQITFHIIDEVTIMEFEITSKKDDSVVFYLHFELADEKHSKKLYDEMVDTLLNLANTKNVRVLLSCSSGLTTSMFADKLNNTAHMLELDYKFNAVGQASIFETIDQYDVLFIAPQIGYLYGRLKESLPNKLVLKIPTAMFAGYHAIDAIQYINEQIKTRKAETKIQQCHCHKNDKNILTISMIRDSLTTSLAYRYYSKGEIIDENRVIKPKLNINDGFDIIDTMTLKHGKVDVIGLAIPGVVSDAHMTDEIHIKNYSQYISNKCKKKYHIDCFMTNNANATCVGFSLEHPEFKNIVYHTQPYGLAYGGQGIMVNGELITGKGGISGEITFFLRRMQFSNDMYRLAKNESGVLEIVTKALLPAIALIGPEAIAIRSQITPDMNEIRYSLSKFIPEDFLPELFYIKDATSYILDGLTKLCVDHLEKE